MRLLPERTERFEAFVATARARPQLWRLAAGAALASACWLAATGAVLVGFARPGEPVAGRVALLAYLAAFGALILGLALAARLLHRRGLASLLGPGAFRPRDFALGAAVILAVTLVGLPVVLLAAPPVLQASPAAWARWLPLALPAILVQVAAEELMFRGYLMQGLAARFRARWVWWGLPAAIFGALHWNPVELGANAWLVAMSAGLAGLVLGDVTARTGNLSLAIGLHFANNAVALLVVALPSPLDALSLFVLSVDPGDAAAVAPFLFLDLAAIVAAYAAWLAIR